MFHSSILIPSVASSNADKCSPWRRMGRLNVYIHVFLTSALAGAEWSALRGGKAPEFHWTEGWVKILDSTGTQLEFLGRPARSQSLYWQRYSGSILVSRILRIMGYSILHLQPTIEEHVHHMAQNTSWASDGNSVHAATNSLLCRESNVRRSVTKQHM
jgi:hypothetical protein